MLALHIRANPDLVNEISLPLCTSFQINFLQNWLAFSKLHKSFFAEHGSVLFPNTKPPIDENNNAYCKVGERLLGK